MDAAQPTLEMWKDLYDAAAEFKGIACWEYMHDSDLFGVQSTQTGEIGYCCIMGNLGEFFALGVNLGDAGLLGHARVQSGEFIGDPDGAMKVQLCLMCMFGDRDDAVKEDRIIIKRLGLKFHGRNAWPVFRHHQPGYFPWFLTAEQAVFLAHGLRQSVDVALRFKEKPNLLDGPSPDQILVRVPRLENDRLQWQDVWKTAPLLERPALEAVPLDGARLQKMKDTIKHRIEVLEIGSHFAPEGVREKKERPYWPYITLGLDRRSEMILVMDLAKFEDYGPGLIDKTLDQFESAKFLPLEIHVADRDLEELLSPLAAALNIALRRVHRLPAFDRACKELMKFTQRRR